MTPWVLLDSAQVPGNGGELCLYQRGDEFSIKITGRGELMNSRVHGSEEALAELTCARLGKRPTVRVLIGGLGIGFSVRAALDMLGSARKVVVAELVSATSSATCLAISLVVAEAEAELAQPVVQIYAMT